MLLSAFDPRPRIEIVNRISEGYRKQQYAILFYSLLGTIACGPIARLAHLRAHLIEMFLGFNLLAAIFPISKPRERAILLGILGLAVLLRTPLVVENVPSMEIVNLFVQISMAMLAGFAALRFAMLGSAISREHIYAALSAYVLVGIFVGALYSAMEHIWPGSFSINGHLGRGEFPLPTAAYFSFVTLVTLGFGDIVPTSEAARSLVVCEAIAGQTYLAVMVARLVSLYVVGELTRTECEGAIRAKG